MIEVKSIPNKEKMKDPSANQYRPQLLAGIPVTEKRITLSGISTPYLEGGEGPPLLLLHGPGENAFGWMRIIPNLITSHRVIIPDLPGHGASTVKTNTLRADTVFTWLGELIEKTCSVPPVLVGHVLGGSIAARFAIKNGEKIRSLILVDSLGLGKFRPSLRFAFGLIRFIIQPTENNFNRFFPQCVLDADNLKIQMEKQWDLFLNYNLECSHNPGQQKAMRTLMKKLGIPTIPPADLARIQIPTALIWGRHDRANKLSIAEKASKRYGWPLYIIEDTRDDPKLEQPDAFVDVLRKILKLNY
jgi:pimeloyl-ACP methyl ester carboxylesterase